VGAKDSELYMLRLCTYFSRQNKAVQSRADR
jgi:hypothetical protein